MKSFICKRFDPRGDYHLYKINLKIQKQEKQSANELHTNEQDYMGGIGGMIRYIVQ